MSSATGNKEVIIPVASLASASIINPTIFTNGVLSFTVVKNDGSETEVSKNVTQANANPYAVIITKQQQKNAEAFVDEIENVKPSKPLPMQGSEQYKPNVVAVQVANDEELTPAEERICTFTSKETKETFELFQRAIVYRKGFLTRDVHPLAGVSSHLESGSELESRVTATRLLLVGPFAFAFKKKKGGEKYITIDGSDFAMMIEVPRKQIKDAMKFVNSVNNAAMKLPAETQAASSNLERNSDDVADQLSKIASLHDSGVLSDEEFATAKKRILGI